MAETERHQCPCDPACKCVMDEPCLGCETYAGWLLKDKELTEIAEDIMNSEY